MLSGFTINFNCTLTVNICNVYRISSYKACISSNPHNSNNSM